MPKFEVDSLDKVDSSRSSLKKGTIVLDQVLDTLQKQQSRTTNFNGQKRSRWFNIKVPGQTATIQFLQEIEEGLMLPRHDRWEDKLPAITCLEFYEKDCPQCRDGMKVVDHFFWNVYNFDNKQVEILDSKLYEGSIFSQLIATHQNMGSITKYAFTVQRQANKTMPFLISIKDLSRQSNYAQIERTLSDAKSRMYDVSTLLMPRLQESEISDEDLETDLV